VFETSVCTLQVLQRLRHVKGVVLEVPWRPLRALLRRQLLARTQTYESECLRLWLSCCILLVLKHALLGTSPDRHAVLAS
jgi:hypothetical protein